MTVAFYRTRNILRSASSAADGGHHPLGVGRGLELGRRYPKRLLLRTGGAFVEYGGQTLRVGSAGSAANKEGCGVPVNLAEGYQDRTREHKIGVLVS
jgi:hypothetical protein